MTREKGARTGLVKYKQLSFVEEGPARLGDQLPRNLVKWSHISGSHQEIKNKYRIKQQYQLLQITFIHSTKGVATFSTMILFTDSAHDEDWEK